MYLVPGDDFSLKVRLGQKQGFGPELSFDITLASFPTLFSDSSDWFWLGGEWGAAFAMGFTLGLACMLGDTAGSFVKRRRGLKREGDESSKAPLLDTVPFAVSIFLFAFLLFDDQIIMHEQLHDEIIALLVLTPIIHRLFNVLGYRLGLKSVPY